MRQKAENSRNKKLIELRRKRSTRTDQARKNDRMGSKMANYEKTTEEGGMGNVKKRRIVENKKRVRKLDTHLQAGTLNVRGTYSYAKNKIEKEFF